MADERDLELLDDYLTNRMSEQDRSAFEQKLKADPDLQHEHALQKRFIQGIKNARVTELKSMLNNVPIPASGTGNALGSKIVLGTVATVIIAGAAYWFTRDDQSTTSSTQHMPMEETAPSTVKAQEMEPTKENTTPQAQSPTTDQKVVETDKNQTSAGTEHSKPSLAKRPDPLSAPAAKNSYRTDANEKGNSETDSEIHFSSVAPSLTVEMGTSTQYTFHYQLREGKVLLFGPFEKNQYEVMEFMIEGKRAAFLYYKDQYYQLQEAGSQIKPLTAVTDQAMLKKLADHYRSR